MNRFLGPVTAPDPIALADVQRLCDVADGYTHDDELFLRAMNESNAWHAKRSPFFASLHGDRGPISDLREQPFVHANFFKMHRVVSIADTDVKAHMTSSGTTGQKSQMYFDDWTLGAGRRMVARLFQHNGWISDDPVNYLLYYYQPQPGLQLGTAATGQLTCQFAPANATEYGLPNTGSGHEFDPFGAIRALLRFADEGLPVRIFGFPSFLAFTLDRMVAAGVPSIQLPPGSLVMLGGGWKGNADKQIGKPELYQRIHEQLGIADDRIRDSFGSVEHSVPYFECAGHRMHVPSWSRVLIRSVRTLEPLPYGEKGYLQFLSPYITSAPAQSVLMGDLASLHPADECGCGLSTPWFAVHGRAGVSRNRSCAVAAAEMLKGRS